MQELRSVRINALAFSAEAHCLFTELREGGVQRGVRAERGGDRALRAQLHAKAAARRALRVLRRRERRRERRARGVHEAHAERRARVPHAALARRVVHRGLSRAHLQPHVHGMRRVARLVSILCCPQISHFTSKNFR